MKKIFKNNIIIVALTFLIPGIIAFLIKDSFMAFKALNKPPLSPSPIVFPIVWSILYILLSISIIRVKDENDDNIKLYYLSLILNAIWTPIFFGLKWYFLALIDLVILLYTVIRMYKKFKEYDDISAYLLIPYIVWLIFAFYLNFSIMVMN